MADAVAEASGVASLERQPPLIGHHGFRRNLLHSNLVMGAPS